MQQYEQATFAGGCFWCMVKPFDQYEGVISVVSGYTGGHVSNPTYEQVCQGDTGHTEAVQITFDPKKISYKKLLDIFWQQIDPTDQNGQFADRGDSYRPVIFYHNEFQHNLALESKKELEASSRFTHPIRVAIEPAVAFYPAEEYHQDFYKKQSQHYNRYYQLSGRSAFLSQHWQDKSKLKSE
ncbi:peptide-methionine (S)-S-oxide reductase MsrA [Gilliamella sp. G0441]|uniref:peptide-methionine (S)-S-oxide reductase MsrA n=1 Tax=Gilliamella sp. G0441 TaxID=3384760 RepID=UPI003D33F8A9